MRTDSFHRAYHGLLCELLHADEETNRRTGTKIKLLDGGHSFKLDLSDGQLPVVHNRRYFPRVAAAETAWQFMGTQDPSFILQHAPKIWQDFVEADGKIRCAYGYRWRSHFGRDQVEMALRALAEDPSNRQVYVSTWDPATDGLGAPDQPKNVPCITSFSLTRTGRYIHMSVFIRSSDVFVGLPYDVMGYALNLDAFAASCGYVPGTLHVTLAHPHVYEPHFKALRRSVSGIWSGSGTPSLPCWTIENILEHPDEYVGVVKTMADRVQWNEWDPKPGVVV